MDEKSSRLIVGMAVWGLAMMCTGVWAAQLGTVFTYQGRILKDGVPVNDDCDCKFSLYGDAEGTTSVGATQTIPGVAISDGFFTVELNGGGEFGPNAFTGDERFLEIGVQCPPDVSFTPLGPLLPITAAPFAHFALNAPDGHSLNAVDGSPNDAVFVNNQGFVGIGSTVPSDDLHVHTSNGDVAIRMTSGGSWALVLKQTDASLFTVENGGQERIAVAAGGNVGVGTTSPAHLTHLSGTNPSLMIENNGLGAAFLRFNRTAAPETNYIALGNNNTLFFKVGGGDRMVIDSTGSIGIGTNSPTARLEVRGGETILEQEDWQIPTLLGGWSNTGDPFAPAGYYKDSMGIVHLRGRVENGVLDVFNLPPGYRPAFNRIFRVHGFAAGGVFIQVHSTGEVEAGTATTWTFLDGITFRAAN